MKKLLASLLLVCGVASAQTEVIPGRRQLNITPTTCTNQFLSAISATGTGTCTGLTLAAFPSMAANTALANATSGPAAPTAFAMPSCSTAGSALIWTTNTGWGCNSSITANTSTTATTATSATTTAITDDTSTNATVFPTWVNAASGNLGQAVSSTLLTFNPSTSNLAVGSTPSAVAGERIVVTDNFNGVTIVRSSNPDSTDTGSIAVMESKSSGAVGRLAAHGGGRVATGYGVTLANYVELSVNSGNGLLIGSTSALPVIAGTNRTRGLTIDANSQAVSLRGSQTNDSATAGDVGELIPGTVAANTTSLSTGSTSNVGANTNITLTAGDWDCTGVVNFTFGATTSITNLTGGISTTTGTLPAQDSYFDYETSAIVPTGSAVATWVVPTVRISASGSTPVFLVSQATFTVSTIKVGGTIRCRRMR